MNAVTAPEPMSRRPLAGVVLLAAAIRVAYWVTKWDQTLLFNDSVYYSGQARQLFEGTWFREVFFDRPGAEHGPLTSLLMSPLSFGTDYHRWQRLVTVTTGVLLVWVLGRLVTELAGSRAGLIAALVAAVYPNFWMNDGLVMSESISMLLVTLSLWAAWRAAQAPDGRGAVRTTVLLGLVLGFAMLARSELLLFVPLLLAWLLVVRRRARRSWRPAVLALVVSGGVVLPWVAFNMARFERPVFLTTNDGTTWLGANCDDMYHGGNSGGWTVLCITADPAYRPDEEPSVRSARQRSLAVHYVRGHLGDVPGVVIHRVGRTLDVYGLSDLLHQDVGEERPRWAAWAGIVMFWGLAVLSVLGAIGAPRRVWTLLVVPICVVLATTVLFYGGHRIRSTAEPSLVALSAMAVAGFVGRRAELVDEAP
jgi:4-amino-4-deoxy-L-arabinose transferase-like glycosyltransferase